MDVGPVAVGLDDNTDVGRTVTPPTSGNDVTGGVVVGAGVVPLVPIVVSGTPTGGAVMYTVTTLPGIVTMIIWGGFVATGPGGVVTLTSVMLISELPIVVDAADVGSLVLNTAVLGVGVDRALRLINAETMLAAAMISAPIIGARIDRCRDRRLPSGSGATLTGAGIGLGSSGPSAVAAVAAGVAAGSGCG
jgi:hypothetical protein